jgi:hydroxyquinol 1,2-dioxygenase
MASPPAFFEPERSAEVVEASFGATEDSRLRAVLGSLVRHLHEFVHEVRLRPEEWQAAIEFLTATGQTSTPTRQEFILLSDVLGVSMLVESLDNRDNADILGNEAAGQLTEATVEGPFHVVESPPRELGADINDANGPGEPCLVTGHVRDETGSPVPGATVDVWQANAGGFYDVQESSRPIGDLRGRFTADGQGRFHFRTVVPSHYPIPTDGPVGSLLRATGRHEFRPAHIHFQVSAPGLRTLTTHVFVAGSPYLESDAVFGVRQSLVRDFEVVDDARAAAEAGMPSPYRWVDFPVTLRRDPGDRHGAWS